MRSNAKVAIGVASVAYGLRSIWRWLNVLPPLETEEERVQREEWERESAEKKADVDEVMSSLAQSNVYTARMATESRREWEREIEKRLKGLEQQQANKVQEQEQKQGQGQKQEEEQQSPQTPKTSPAITSTPSNTPATTTTTTLAAILSAPPFTPPPSPRLTFQEKKSLLLSLQSLYLITSNVHKHSRVQRYRRVRINGEGWKGIGGVFEEEARDQKVEEILSLCGFKRGEEEDFVTFAADESTDGDKNTDKDDEDENTGVDGADGANSFEPIRQFSAAILTRLKEVRAMEE